MNAEIKKLYYIFDYYDKRSADLGYRSQIEFLKEGKIKVERIDVMDLPIISANSIKIKKEDKI